MGRSPTPTTILAGAPSVPSSSGPTTPFSSEAVFWKQVLITIALSACLSRLWMMPQDLEEDFLERFGSVGQNVLKKGSSQFTPKSKGRSLFDMLGIAHSDDHPSPPDTSGKGPHYPVKTSPDFPPEMLDYDDYDYESATKMVLLRSIGNPLPPRHDRDQAVRSLNFTLTYEPDYPNIKRHWVLNRIVDEDMLEHILNMLEDAGEAFSIIPFNLTLYTQVPYSYQYYPDYKGNRDVLHDRFYKTRFSFAKKFWVDDSIMHDKNMYVNNVNGGRNAMLQIGRTMYGKDSNYPVDWILPWDGNCFMTPVVHAELSRHLDWIKNQKEPKKWSDKYIVVPMTRVQKSNFELLNPNFKPNAIEEHQVVFASDAVGNFHPYLRYGRRNKVEFLSRLNVDGDNWFNRTWLPWEAHMLNLTHQDMDLTYKFQQERPELFPERMSLQAPPSDMTAPVSMTAWIARLHSGNSALESGNETSARMSSRLDGIQNLMYKLDYRWATEVYNYQPRKTLLYYKLDALEEEKAIFQKYKGNKRKPDDANDRVIVELVNLLIKFAKENLQEGPWAVTDKPPSSVAPSGDPHDYYNIINNFRPAELGDGTFDLTAPFVKAKRVPGTYLYEDGSEQWDVSRISAMQHNVTVWSLAYFFSEDKRFSKKAVEAVDKWFINPKTRMNPHMEYSQVKWNHNITLWKGDGVIEFRGVFFLLDAIRLLQLAGQFSDEQNEQLLEWFSAFLEWLETSDLAIRTMVTSDFYGLWYDCMVSSIAVFVGDDVKAMKYFYDVQSRLRAHLDDDRIFRLEKPKTHCEHLTMFALEGWNAMARLAQSMGVDVWNYYIKDLDLESQDVAQYRLPDDPLYAEQYSGPSALCQASANTIPFVQDREPCSASHPGGGHSANKQQNSFRWHPMLDGFRRSCPQFEIANENGPTWMTPDEARKPPKSRYQMPPLFDHESGIPPFWNLGYKLMKNPHRT